MKSKRAVIIGGGPAGLTAAYELLTRVGVTPVVLERDEILGGISRTVNYKGNRIDIGGHRFFSKSERVMSWWLDQLPLQGLEGNQTITYHRMQTKVPSVAGPDPDKTDAVMLLRERRSRIYYMRRFFQYPITLSIDTVRRLGIWNTILIGLSYVKSSCFPIRGEKTLEQFFINRFGRRLYLTFFKSYTEKVWGVPCDRISAEWGMQRIKGLSARHALAHAARKLLGGKRQGDLAQKGTETSLIEKFLYPKLGPGQMWEEVARKVTALGGSILKGMRVDRVRWQGRLVEAVEAVNPLTGEREVFEGDYFLSTMPIRDLMRAMQPGVPEPVLEVSEGLVYRDFIMVGMLVRNLKIKEPSERGGKLIRDNWIYIQEPDVLVGRLQIFNNWSPYLVADPGTVWLGLEYFCDEGDHLWRRSDAEMIALAKEELSRIGIIDSAGVLDATVLRLEKTYPAYFGTFPRFAEIRSFVDGLDNLYLIGRNGMHRYNNQDHSMLTAMVAADNIQQGRTDKSNIWEVNTEPDYHEEK